MSTYEFLSKPPANALRTIQGGRLKGKTDINPQWKIEAMTNAYGTCGIGWKHELAKIDTVNLDSGEVMVFMQVNVYIKENDIWSDAIVGMGGDFLVQREKSGLVANDEAYKMCYTDALGNALKNIGVAADVYRGFCDTKYGATRNDNTPSSAHQNANGYNYIGQPQKAPQNGTTGAPGASIDAPESATYACDGCGAQLPATRVKYCKQQAAKLGGRILCYTCENK